MRQRVWPVAILALGLGLAPSVLEAAVAFRAAASNGALASGTITFRNAASTDQNGTALTLLIAVPPGTVNGDVMVAGISVRPNTAVITAPAGWTLVLRQDSTIGGNFNSLAVYTRVASS